MKEYSINRIVSPHCKVRKNPSDVSLIVLHATGTNSLQSTINWFQDPVSKVSSHYLVGQKGEVYQFVSLEFVAWHAGVSEWEGRKNVNNFSIGIELVNDGKVNYTEEQYDVCAFLCCLIKKKFNFTLDKNHIVGHYEISPGRKTDPYKSFDWEKLLSLVTC